MYSHLIIIYICSLRHNKGFMFAYWHALPVCHPTGTRSAPLILYIITMTETWIESQLDKLSIACKKNNSPYTFTGSWRYGWHQQLIHCSPRLTIFSNPVDV
jgi:hypothetical protein